LAGGFLVYLVIFYSLHFFFLGILLSLLLGKIKEKTYDWRAHLLRCGIIFLGGSIYIYARIKVHRLFVRMQKELSTRCMSFNGSDVDKTLANLGKIFSLEQMKITFSDNQSPNALNSCKITFSDYAITKTISVNLRGIRILPQPLQRKKTNKEKSLNNEAHNNIDVVSSFVTRYQIIRRLSEELGYQLVYLVLTYHDMSTHDIIHSKHDTRRDYYIELSPTKWQYDTKSRKSFRPNADKRSQPLKQLIGDAALENDIDKRTSFVIGGANKNSRQDSLLRVVPTVLSKGNSNDFWNRKVKRCGKHSGGLYFKREDSITYSLFFQSSGKTVDLEIIPAKCQTAFASDPQHS